MDIYDLVIKNGALVDTENNKVYTGNICINGSKIVKLSEDSLEGQLTIDAVGLVVCPGFIDIHAHLDGNIDFGRLAALQGITTSIGGNCGAGPSEIGIFLEKQSEIGFPINQGQLIGHSFTLRNKAGIESPYLPATKDQIAIMLGLAEKAFKEGALGLSFGLEYSPGASHEEVVELCKFAASYDKLVPIHTYVNNPENLDSLTYVIELSRLTGAHILVSHFVYQYGYGVMTKALKLVDEARSQGLKISVDSGMYTAFCTGMGTTIYDEEYMNKFGWKYSDLLVASGKHKGKRLNEELYHEMRKHCPRECVICYQGVEEEIYEALEKEYVVLSTDTGPGPSGDVTEGHPQNTGNFPRFFRKLVRELNRLTLLEAVKKCTIMPAEILKLKDKGRLSEGKDADIVIFDLETISDTSDFPGQGSPDSKPTGIKYVIVNGKILVEDGNIKDILPGSIIKA
ncbi:MAG TPA: amidohydrolase family protein [Clostridiaceae bacterium]